MSEGPSKLNITNTARNSLSAKSFANSNTTKQTRNSILDSLNDILSKNLSSLGETIGLSSNKNSKNTTNNSTKIINMNSIINIDFDNYFYMISIIIVIILLASIYIFSKSFNVSRTLTKLNIYSKFLVGDNYNIEKNKDLPLHKLRFGAAYNPCHVGKQMYGYTSEIILKNILKTGARYIDLNIFASQFGSNAYPVISQGYKLGEWKMTLNKTPFEDAIKVIAENAFIQLSKDGGAPNPDDPLIIGLNLSTGHNIYCLDKICDIIVEYLSDYLLSPKYAYNFNNNIHNITMSKLTRKVVILASNGFEGSKLEELINGVWYDMTELDTDAIASNIIFEGFVNKIKTKNLSTKNQTNKEVNSNNSNNSSNNSKKVLGLDADHAEKKLEQNLLELEKKLKKDNNIENGPNEDSTNFTSNESIELSMKQINDTEYNLNKKINNELYINNSNNEYREEKNKENQAENNDNNDNNDEDNDEDNENVENYNNVLDHNSNNSKNIFNLLDDSKPNNKYNIIRISAKVINTIGFTGLNIKKHNEHGLTIVVPHSEGDIITRNYDESKALDLGCQLICQNFQLIDSHMDKYITKFKYNMIILK
jgi:hypothetical protein